MDRCHGKAILMAGWRGDVAGVEVGTIEKMLVEVHRESSAWPVELVT